MKRRQTLGAVVGMVAFLLAGGIVIGKARAQSGGTPAGAGSAGPKRAEEQYKNIQVLKGIPADQLIPGMQSLRRRLGWNAHFAMWKAHSKRMTRSPNRLRGR